MAAAFAARLFSKLSQKSRIHFVRLQGSKVEVRELQSADIDLQSICTSQPGKWPTSSSCIEIFFVPLCGFGTERMRASYKTLVSLIEVARISSEFVDILGDNNGVCTSLDSDEENENSRVHKSLAIKIPFARYLNGAIYFRYDIVNMKTTLVAFFHPNMMHRLFGAFKSGTETTADDVDPFGLLALRRLLRCSRKGTARVR